MSFASFTFVYFLVIVFSIYWILNHKWQNRFLLVASYVFYGYWDWRFLAVLWISTLVDYFAAIKIEEADSAKARKTWLVASLSVNLGILFVFKYYGFFAESLADALKSLGLVVDLPILKVVLPLGISFYTFQSMSYTIDVYREEIPATRNLWQFCLFVIFFPQLVAGPIERASALLKQIEVPRALREPTVWMGLFWLLMGFYKKVVVAENLVPFTKPVFAEPKLYSGGDILMSVYTGMMQVYCDFSGYSDIAVGLGLLFGFKLTVNFRQPLLSNNPSELWRRWHVTLYYWIRDYLYMPLLKRNLIRNKTANMVMTVLITFLLAGLWHGAAWNFMAWSMLLAVLLILHRLALPVLSRLQKLVPSALAWRVIGIVTFFHCWMAVSVFFAGQDMGRIKTMFVRFWEEPWTFNPLSLTTLVVFGLPVLVYDIGQEWSGDQWVFTRWHPVVQALAMIALFGAIAFCGVGTVSEFEYFQF